MERLWAPWRMEYIQDHQSARCIFCQAWEKADDPEKLALHKTPLSVVLMNKYPYSNGHLLVAPVRHVAELDFLAPEELADIFSAVALSTRILKNRISAEGFNIGINVGRTAGAGIVDHIHVHIVPRWHGDTNFMSVMNDVRVLPEALEQTYNKLLPAFQKHREVMP